MELRTPVHIPDYPFQLTPDSRGLLLGSCFVQYIGQWLINGKMPLSLNPFGTLYNPASIARSLHLLATPEPLTPADLFQHNGLWHSFMHHSSYSGTDPETTLAGMNTALLSGGAALRHADYLLLTLGTTWVYEQQGRVVANCHKLPARAFLRRPMSVAQIVATLGEQIETLKDRHIILTVSPVIHPGDGLTGNQLSKSTLIVAAHELAAQFPHSVHYFPAYEIVTSELRDYRFYADDMCHPSPVGIQYVRERFSDTLLTADTVEMIAAAGELKKAMEHRPLHPDSPEYQQFRTKMHQKAEAQQRRYKNADFTEEVQYFG